MSIIKSLLETAAAGSVGAGAIATGGGHETVVNLKRKTQGLTKAQKGMFAFARNKKGWHFVDLKDNNTKKVAESLVAKGLIEMNSFGQIRYLSELDLSKEESDFDPASVISKLNHAQKTATVDNNDAVGFALEDDEGNIVKVYVKKDQAEDFEQALEAELADELKDDENKRDKATAKEIGEVLFNLRNRFDIVDVNFASIPEDEEEQQEAAGGEGGGEEAVPAEGEGQEGGEDQQGDETEMQVPGLEPGAEAGGGDEAAAGLLQQVIDMMKQDAEARKAEAEANKEQAKAKQSEYIAQAAAHKVKQEEQILDMEEYNKSKSEEDKEAKRLAQLAKWKHDLAKDKAKDSETEDEEMAMVTAMINKRLHAQK